MKPLKTNITGFLFIAILISSFSLNGQVKAPILDGKVKVSLLTKQTEMKAVSPFKDLKWKYIGPTNISGRCTDVEAVSPRGENYTIWVGSATGGVWKSINEGTTFEPVFEAMPTASTGDIAIDPKNSSVVWVGTGEANIFRSSNAGCGVFKTIDGGKTWNLMGLENTYTIGRIRINPKNPDIVYVAATGHEWTPNEDRGLFKTKDGGMTWIKSLYIDKNTGVADVVLDPNNPDIIYCTAWERMRLKWNDPRTYETTMNNGIWKSTDGGENWKKINEGLPSANMRGRIGIDIAVNPIDNNTIYSSTFYGALARAEINTYPGSIKYLLPNRLPGEENLRGEWVAPSIISTHNPDIIYHGMQYVMLSRDKGDTWEIISPDLSYNDPKKRGDINYQTISVLDESPLRFGLLYAGTDDGRIWRTKDVGKNWTEIRNGAVPQKFISRIVASSYDIGTVYMTQTGRRDDDFQVYIWKSTDFGDSWQDISGNIPVGPVNVIREDPANSSILYIGTDAGVFITKDGGKKWDILGNLPLVYVHDLAIHPRDNMIIIATHGRGMWVMDANPINEKDKKKSSRDDDSTIE